MAKASFTLPNGTTVHIEGSPDEVKALLGFYSVPHPSGGTPASPGRTRHPGEKKPKSDKADTKSSADLTEIIAQIKTCDDAENIEKNILDRPSAVNRVLLPLYIVHKHLGNAFGLSSGEIAKITKDLGVPVAMANASRRLSGAAAKFVVGDRMRRRGRAVRYKLSRRGLQHMKTVIAGKSSADPD